MGQRSKIAAFVRPEDRRRIDRWLAEGKKSLDEIVAYLSDQGYTIGRSSVGRYAQRFRVEADRLRRANEFASMMVAEIGEPAAQGKLGRVIAQMVQIVAMDHLAAREDGGESQAAPRDLMFIARALKDALAAAKMEIEQELAIREATAQEAARAVEAEAQDAGLSEETIARFRASILGVVQAPPPAPAS